MQIIKDFLNKLILVALVFGLAGPVLAIQTQSRMSQGNNVQLDFTDNGSGVLSGGTSMFPKGSGNLIPVYNGGWGHCIAVARDKNGDGAIEDTLYGTYRARSIGYMNGSLESYAELEALWNAGEYMDNAADRLEHNRVWSSLDPDDMADWPPEFREGRTASGDPILHGAETIVVRLSDAFNRGFAASNVPRGVSFEYRFHFLNFGESNDMAYGHLFIRNMSEYLKWNPNPGFRDQVASTPDGQKWNFALCYYTIYFGIGSDAVSMDEGYTYHPAREIVCVTDRDGLEGDFTKGGVTFNVGHKMLRSPAFKGQTMVMTGFHGMRWGADFGGPTTQDLYQMGSAGLVYRASLGELYPNLDELCQQMYKGALNPVTGRPAWGIPGLPRPTDQYYDVWLWGRQGRTQYNTFAEIKDFGPRDSTSCDFVFMFVYPDSPPLVFKANDVANIYDPDMQVKMKPMEHYAQVAQVVYEGGYILPETPIPPSLTIVPGDRQVTITWSEVNLNIPDAYYALLQKHPELDPQRLYRQYDFEGYRVYRSTTGRLEEAKLVAQFDLANGIVLATGITPTGDTLGISKYDRSGGSSYGLGRDTGLSYTFVDNEVINGIPYYYSVTGYDWNSLSDSSSTASFSRESWLSFSKNNRAVPKSAAGTGYTLSGDVNTDGQVDLFDILTIVRFALGEKTPTTEERTLADLNSDGKIDILDVLACVDKALGRTLQLAAYSQTDIAQIDRAQLTSNLVSLGADQQLIENVFKLLSAQPQALPKAFSLGQNSPNPFNPSTTISYSVPEGPAVEVSLKIYDLRGRLVRTLVEEMREPGSYSVFWDGRDGKGQQISSGVYLYRMQAGEFTQTRKMVLLK